MHTADATIIELPALERELHPDVVDRHIAAIAHAAETTDAALGFYLRVVDVMKLYYGFGARSTVHYAEARHGIPPFKTYRCLRAAKACARSPVLRDAFAVGEVRLYKMDVIKDVIGLGEDERWVERAKDKHVSYRALRSEVQRRLGEEPDDETIWIRIPCTPTQHRTFNAAVVTVSRVAGRNVGNAEALEAISIDYINAIHDESQRHAALVLLDPEIPRREDGTFDRESNRVAHRGEPDACDRSVKGPGMPR